MRKRLLTIIFIAIASLSFAQTQKVTIYNEWRSNNCEYRAQRPFSVLRNTYEFHRFWIKSGIDDIEPTLDFSKYMVFLWIPGSSLYDPLESRIEEVQYKNGDCLVLFDFKRKNAGKWVKPVIATVLPKIDGADFFIFKKNILGYNKFEWQHMASLWDMDKVRVKTFDVAKVDMQEDSTQEFLIAKDSHNYKEIVASALQAPQTTQSTPSSWQQRAEAQQYVQPVTPQPQYQQQPQLQQEETTDFSIESLFEAAEQTPKEEVRPEPTFQPRPSISQPTIPTLMEEDPLFGSEFDITF